MAGTSASEELNRIAREHSYEAGFNGRLSKYRIIKIAEAIQSYPKNARVLEIGAGEGPVTSYLASRFDEVLALEPAEEFYAKLEKRFSNQPKVHLLHSLFEDAKIEGQFDVIVAAGVLEHVQDAVKFLKKTKSLLKAGGSLVLTVPNATSLHRHIGVQLGMLKELHELSAQDHFVGHYRYYDSKTLRHDIESAGYSVRQISGIMLKMFPNTEMNELAEEFCDALFYVGEQLPEWGAELFAVAEMERP